MSRTHTCAPGGEATPREGALALAWSDPRGAGVPVVFVHGVAHNRAVWEAIAEALPADLRPISLDLRGHGESPWSMRGDYALRSHARDLGRLLDDLGIARAHLVAHSLGGNVATLFASAHPERVRSLVLVDTGPALDLTAVARVADEVGSILRSYASVAEYRERLARMHPNGDAAVLDRLATTGVVRRLDGRFEPAFDPGVLGSEDVATDLDTVADELWSALRSVACPVLLVRGGQSAVLDESVAAAMTEVLAAPCGLVTLPESGHSVMLDDGSGLAAAVCDFLASRT